MGNWHSNTKGTKLNKSRPICFQWSYILRFATNQLSPSSPQPLFVHSWSRTSCFFIITTISCGCFPGRGRGGRGAGRGPPEDRIPPIQVKQRDQMRQSEQGETPSHCHPQGTQPTHAQERSFGHPTTTPSSQGTGGSSWDSRKHSRSPWPWTTWISCRAGASTKRTLPGSYWNEKQASQLLFCSCLGHCLITFPHNIQLLCSL